MSAPRVRAADVPRPMLDRMSEHDSPHGADMDQTYRTQTDCLALKMSGATRTWMWDHFPLHTVISSAPSVATYPAAYVTAAETWTAFGFASSGVLFDVGLPWRFTEGHEKILIYTVMMTNADVALKVRWDSQTLVDAVGTATGEVSGVGHRPSSRPDVISWLLMAASGGNTWGQGSWYSWLTPNIPANRRIKLVPYVKVRGDLRFDVSGEIPVVMRSAAVMDVPARDTVGW